MKTDNRNLPAKLRIREWLIDRSGFVDLKVLDLCSGKGVIWQRLQKSRRVIEYTPCDRKPRQPGSIAGEAEVLLLAFDLSQFNVIDVDTYGEPWAEWCYLAGAIKTPTLVFLTCGAVSSPGGCGISSAVREALGIPKSWAIPQKKELANWAGEYILAEGAARAGATVSGRMILPNVRYYALQVSGNAA